MRNISKFFFLFGMVLFGLAIVSCDDDQDSTTVEDSLTLEEQADLLYLREEEKLARDVYSYLAELYEINIFENITSSEQRHIDYILDMMDKYDIDDPVTDDDPGVFTLAEIQALYDSLTTSGESSLLAALFAGATIEDKDIFDLTEAISGTTNQDLVGLYELLMCGSRNHMRAFDDQIKEQNSYYEPQYISQDEFIEIIQGTKESCHE